MMLKIERWIDRGTLEARGTNISRSGRLRTREKLKRWLFFTSTPLSERGTGIDAPSQNPDGNGNYSAFRRFPHGNGKSAIPSLKFSHVPVPLIQHGNVGPMLSRSEKAYHQGEGLALPGGLFVDKGAPKYFFTSPLQL